MPEESAEEQKAREAADDQAVGHVVRMTFKDTLASLFSGRQGVIIIALSLLTAGREGWHMFQGAQVVPAKEFATLEHTLNKVSENVLDVKVTVKSMLDVMPKAQQEKANALIRDRMEVLAQARHQAATHDDE